MEMSTSQPKADIGFSVELPVYHLLCVQYELVKLLTALDTDVEMQVNKAGDTAFSINLADKTTTVTFMLADLSVIRQVPQMKQLPDFNVKIKLTDTFADKFIKSKNISEFDSSK